MPATIPIGNLDPAADYDPTDPRDVIPFVRLDVARRTVYVARYDSPPWVRGIGPESRLILAAIPDGASAERIRAAVERHADRIYRLATMIADDGYTSAAQRLYRALQDDLEISIGPRFARAE